jgi:predicted tellurium resistance membrane protein TerC
LSVVAIIQGITHLKLLQISNYIAMSYVLWAIGQFFDKKKAISYVKAFLSVILGSIIFEILIQVVGGIIDIIIKH